MIGHVSQSSPFCKYRKKYKYEIAFHFENKKKRYPCVFICNIAKNRIRSLTGMLFLILCFEIMKFLYSFHDKIYTFLNVENYV